MLSKNKLGFYELTEKPSAQELASYYQEKYYQEARGSYELSYTQPELDYFDAKHRRIHYLVNLHQGTRDNRSLLDVGCGEGFALSYFSRHGFDVRGLDFSDAGIHQQNPSFRESIETGDLFLLLKERVRSGARNDVVILQNVLEHVIDPFELCLLIKQLLEPKGVAIITVPNDFSLTQKTALSEGRIDREFWVCPPDHLSYFNYESLKNILVYSGFTVDDMIADFPIDWYLFHPGSNYIQDPSNGKAAHFSRIIIENMLQANDISDVVCFYRSLAKLGAGRDLTAVVSVNHFT